MNSFVKELWIHITLNFVLDQQKLSHTTTKGHNLERYPSLIIPNPVY